MEHLTPMQRTVLRAIEDLSKDGHAPTQSEVAARVERAPATVYDHAIQLEAKGYIERRRVDRNVFFEIKVGAYCPWCGKPA